MLFELGLFDFPWLLYGGRGALINLGKEEKVNSELRRKKCIVL
jgi:hypothetical protein